MKALSVVAAVDRDRLAGTERDRAAQKGIDGSDISVQVREMKCAALPDGDFAIPLPPNQLINEIGHGDAPVTRELIAAENVHWTGTGLRPQSLATQ
jgi:hypothetical protein